MPERGVLLLGAGGLVGHHVLDALSRCATDTTDIAVLRVMREDPDTLEAPDTLEVPAPAEVVVGRWNSPADLAAALEGIDTVVITSALSDEVAREFALADALATYEREHPSHPGLRILRLSHPSVDDPESESSLAAFHREIEGHFTEVGLACSNLRTAGTMQHTTIAGGGITEHGVLVTSARAEDHIRLVDATDVADVVVHLVTHPELPPANYALEGPDDLGPNEVAHTVSLATGHPIPCILIPPAVVDTYLDDADITPIMVEAIELLHDAVQYPPQPARGATIESLLGRPPRSFATYCTEHREAIAPRRDAQGNCTCTSCTQGTSSDAGIPGFADKR